MHLHSTCHGSYTDLSSLGVYLSRVMANTHTHTNTYTNSRLARSPATTYGNGQARLTFLPRSILPTRPFPVVLSFSLSFYLSIFFSICSSARPPVHLSIRLFFSLPLFLCLDIVQCSYCGRESRPITTRTIREPSTPCVLHLLSFSNPCFSSLLLPRPLFSPAFLTARVFTGPSPLTPPLGAISFEILPDQNRAAASSITPLRAKYPLISTDTSRGITNRRYRAFNHAWTQHVDLLIFPFSLSRVRVSKESFSLVTLFCSSERLALRGDRVDREEEEEGGRKSKRKRFPIAESAKRNRELLLHSAVSEYTDDRAVNAGDSLLGGARA